MSSRACAVTGRRVRRATHAGVRSGTLRWLARCFSLCVLASLLSQFSPTHHPTACRPDRTHLCVGVRGRSQRGFARCWISDLFLASASSWQGGIVNRFGGVGLDGNGYTPDLVILAAPPGHVGSGVTCNVSSGQRFPSLPKTWRPNRLAVLICAGRCETRMPFENSV